MHKYIIPFTVNNKLYISFKFTFKNNKLVLNREGRHIVLMYIKLYLKKFRKVIMKYKNVFHTIIFI